MLTQKKGQEAEQKALEHLLKQGLKLVKRNYYCHFGEIDLIMQDGKHLVIVEVRSRTNRNYGGAIGSITPTKVKKIIKTTFHYLMCHKEKNACPVRFDVVCFEGSAGEMNWIKNAFNADYTSTI